VGEDFWSLRTANYPIHALFQGVAEVGRRVSLKERIAKPLILQFTGDFME